MAGAPASRLWQVFLVLGLIASIASLYFWIGGAMFAAVSGLVTLSIGLLNAFLSPATVKESENWFVGVMKRTVVIGPFAKVACVLLWIAALGVATVLAWSAHEKTYKIDVEGVVIDKFRGTPLEKAFVSLQLANGAILSSDTATGRFKFTGFDRRKAARDEVEIDAVCEGVHGKARLNLSKGSVKDVRIVLSVSLPPTKRTFFVLKGHALDILARDNKLPTELEAKLAGNIFLVDSPPLRELHALIERYSQSMDTTSEVQELYTETDFVDEGNLDAQTKTRDAALKKIEKQQLNRLRQGRVLAPAGGETGSKSTSMYLDAAKLPAGFLANAAWSIEVSELDQVFQKGPRARDRTRLEIPFQKVVLKKFATRADFDALRRAQPRETRDSAEFRFIEYASRNGAPPNFLRLMVFFDECAEDIVVKLDAPDLQLLVVVLENITDKPVALGDFHFRMIEPAAGEASMRTPQDNASLLASRDSKSESWYSSRVLKPGEKVAVPVQLSLSFDSRRDEFQNFEDSDREKEQLRSKEYAEKLSADKEIRTIALAYKTRDSDVKHASVVNMPKQNFVDGLQREPARISKAMHFVYGPSIALDAVDVNGAPYPLDPFNPTQVSYFSGIPIGSCPFIYCCHGTDDKWIRQGSILRGRESKAREGTGELMIHGFDEVLRVSEEEAEISYIDQIVIRARSATGEEITLRPSDDRLARKDGRYIVLKKGESIDVEFASTGRIAADHVLLSAWGYFQPTTPARAVIKKTRETSRQVRTLERRNSARFVQTR